MRKRRKKRKMWRILPRFSRKSQTAKKFNS